MFESIRERISFGNVIALIALFVALGGSAYAVKKISTKQLRNNAVKTKKIAPNAVTNPKVADLKFQSLNFLNGWQAGDPDHGSGPPGVAKDAQGMVHLRGVIRQPSGAGGNAFTLPAGFRPGGITSVPATCLALGVGSAGLFFDPTNGNVLVIATGGDPQNICQDTGLGTSLDGVTFYAGG